MKSKYFIAKMCTIGTHLSHLKKYILFLMYVSLFFKCSKENESVFGESLDGSRWIWTKTYVYQTNFDPYSHYLINIIYPENGTEIEMHLNNNFLILYRNQNVISKEKTHNFIMNNEDPDGWSLCQLYFQDKTFFFNLKDDSIICALRPFEFNYSYTQTHGCKTIFIKK